ncbi:MAG: hypothetical protein IKS20_01895, partial [Victivallales bacterium]|nr:hypothetical protein [Victivallales bacterium]
TSPSHQGRIVATIVQCQMCAFSNEMHASWRDGEVRFAKAVATYGLSQGARLAQHSLGEVISTKNMGYL